MRLPPIGYRDWAEAAEDADENGRLEIVDARDRPAFVQIPDEYLELAKQAELRRAAARLVAAMARADAPADVLPRFSLLRGGLAAE